MVFRGVDKYGENGLMRGLGGDEEGRGEKRKVCD